MSSANAFNLDRCENLSFGKGLIVWPSTTQSAFVDLTGDCTFYFVLLLEAAVNNNAFNPFPNKPWFSRVCSTSLLKTLWEKEKLLVTSNFSFSHSVFYPNGELPAVFIKTKIVVCKLFQFGKVKNLSFGKELKDRCFVVPLRVTVSEFSNVDILKGGTITPVYICTNRETD